MNNATLVSLTAPTTVAANMTFPVTIVMQNTGDTTWTDAGIGVPNAYHLGAYNAANSPPEDTTWGTNTTGAFRVQFPAGTSIAPGQNATFSCTCTAPSAPGTYPLSFRMVQEYVAWFGAIALQSMTVTGAALTGYAIPGYHQEVRPLPPDPGDGSAVGDILLNTGVYTIATGAVWVNNGSSLDWPNTTGKSFKVLQSGIWTGVDPNITCDVGAYVVLLRNGHFVTLVQDQPWDHYANPTAPNQLTLRQHPVPITVQPNDVFRMFYAAAAQTPGGQAAHMFQVVVQY